MYLEWIDDEPHIVLTEEMLLTLGWDNDQDLDYDINDDMIRFFAV